MSRYIIEDENGNRSYLLWSDVIVRPGQEQLPPACAACRERPTRAQNFIVGALGVMVFVWLAWLVVRGLVDWMKTLG